MLGEKQKQAVSKRANESNKLISRLVEFFIQAVIGLDLDRLSCQMNSPIAQ